MLRLSDSLRGKTIYCPACKALVSIDRLADEEPIHHGEVERATAIQDLVTAPEEPFAVDPVKLKPRRFRKRKKRRGRFCSRTSGTI